MNIFLSLLLSLTPSLHPSMSLLHDPFPPIAFIRLFYHSNRKINTTTQLSYVCVWLAFLCMLYLLHGAQVRKGLQSSAHWFLLL